MAARKPKRIGNSVNVILPKDMLARLKLEKSDALHVTDTPDGVRHTPRDPRFAAQMKRVRRIAKKRRAVLRELAR
jgi:putative addiction module antidote